MIALYIALIEMIGRVRLCLQRRHPDVWQSMYKPLRVINQGLWNFVIFRKDLSLNDSQLSRIVRPTSWIYYVIMGGMAGWMVTTFYAMGLS